MIETALILAAGNGSRLRSHIAVPHKSLVAIDGETLLARTCRLLDEVDVGEIIVVTGYEGAAVRAALSELTLARARVRFVENHRWKQSNGLSVLAAADYLDGGEFLLLMADHLFEPELLHAMAQQQPAEGVVLAVDYKLDEIYDMDDATKVSVGGDAIVEIGKDLRDFNAVDTGLFVCSDILVNCLQRVEASKGDCSLTDGMRWLCDQRLLRGFDVGQAWWQDVDTPGALAHGAALLREQRMAVAVG